MITTLPTMTEDDMLEKVVSFDGTVSVMVTPALAGAILKLNTGNRPMRPFRVKKYAYAMREGRWKKTGEPVIISREGIVNDGQHRLMGVVESGVAVPMDIRFGIDRAAFSATGLAAKRTGGDIISMAGLAVPGVGQRASALAAMAARYTIGLPGASSVTFEADILVEIMRLNPDLAALANESMGWPRFMRNSTMLLVIGLSRRHDPQKAISFLAGLKDGAGLGRDDPRLHLRERLRSTVRASMSTQKAAVLDLALAIKAWLAWQAGRPVRSLRWVAEGEKGEAFPYVPLERPVTIPQSARNEYRAVIEARGDLTKRERAARRQAGAGVTRVGKEQATNE